jgi:hypothetical protein
MPNLNPKQDPEILLLMLTVPFSIEDLTGNSKNTRNTYFNHSKLISCLNPTFSMEKTRPMT